MFSFSIINFSYLCIHEKSAVPEPCSRTADKAVIPPCFTHPSQNAPRGALAPCAVMGAPSAVGRLRTLCARLRDHVLRSVPRPFSAAGTLCCGGGARTLPILACDFYFRSNTAKIIQQAQNSVKENRLRAKRRNCYWWKQSRMSAGSSLYSIGISSL